MDSTTLKRTTSDNPDFRLLVKELDEDLRIRNGDMMDIYDKHNIIDKIDTVVLAYINGVPAACGCFKPFDNEAVEIKRMFVRKTARGRGLSLIILTELEVWAKAAGFNFTVLETGSKQTEALGLYPRAGYILIANYGPYVNLEHSICFKKTL